MTTGLEVALGLLTGAECGHILYGRLPSRMTTRKFANEKDKKNNLIALTESCAIGLLLAVLVSSVMKSWIVFAIAITILGLVSLLYLNDIMGWW